MRCLPYVSPSLRLVEHLADVPVFSASYSLLQLFRDYNAYAENHIRNRFESDKCGQLYAPTWMELYRLKKAGDLLPLKNGPRDMDKPYTTADGKKVMRKEAPKSKLLQDEITWLQAYVSELTQSTRALIVRQRIRTHDDSLLA